VIRLGSIHRGVVHICHLFGIVCSLRFIENNDMLGRDTVRL
jgi:hypothetical protein